jgi:hypothetical protein
MEPQYLSSVHHLLCHLQAPKAQQGGVVRPHDLTAGHFLSYGLRLSASCALVDPVTWLQIGVLLGSACAPVCATCTGKMQGHVVINSGLQEHMSRRSLAIGRLHIDAQAPGPGVLCGQAGEGRPGAADLPLHHVHRHRVLAANEARQELAACGDGAQVRSMCSKSWPGLRSVAHRAPLCHAFRLGGCTKGQGRRYHGVLQLGYCICLQEKGLAVQLSQCTIVTLVTSSCRPPPAAPRLPYWSLGMMAKSAGTPAITLEGMPCTDECRADSGPGTTCGHRQVFVPNLCRAIDEVSHATCGPLHVKHLGLWTLIECFL